MEPILSLDVSNETASAVVVTIEGNEVRILESHSENIGSLFSKEVLLGTDFRSSSAAEQNGLLENGAELNGAAHDSPPSAATVTAGLASLLEKIETRWTNAILVVPNYDYLSINVELPFGDSKNINKILGLEIQDLVPFEVEDFLLNHRTIAAVQNGAVTAPRYDVHVGIMPRSYVSQIVALCQSLAFEPYIISTPASALGALYHLAPQYFEKNSAVIYEQDPEYHILSSVDGLARNDRSLNRFNFLTESSGYSGVSDPDKALLTDMKLTLTSIERRYQTKFDKIYYVGSYFSTSQMQQMLGRNVETVTIDEIIKSSDADNGIAALASVFAQDNDPPAILNNFRVREFAYSIQIKEFIRGLRNIAPYAGLFVGAFLFYLLCSYMLTGFQISRLNGSVRDQIAAALPAATLEAGGELKALQGEIQKLEDQLKDISSLSSMNPLDILLEISKDIPESAGVDITSIKIRDNRVEVDGSAKEYEHVDKLISRLNKNPLYDRVKETSPQGGSGRGNKNFNFEIWIKE